jgi:hypothetical protein
MYRTILACKGVSANVGAVAARDITAEFSHRTWHENVTCVWDGSRLILQADNDFDSDGVALKNEFSEAISAYIKEAFGGDIETLSVAVIRAGSNRAINYFPGLLCRQSQ